MEKRIKEFINDHIGVSEISCGNASVNDSGDIEVEGADIMERLHYFCRECNSEIELDPTNRALRKHVVTHLEEREYFVYQKRTFRVFARSEEEAVGKIVDNPKNDINLDVFMIDVEQTEEDFFCDHCGKWFDAHERHNTGDEFDYCKGCFESAMHKCFVCNKNFILRDLTYVEGDNYTCDGCLPPETCDDCGKDLDTDNIRVGKEKYCVDCYSEKCGEEEAKKEKKPLIDFAQSGFP